MTIIDKKKEYYILYNEIVEKVSDNENGDVTFQGVTFPKTSWRVLEDRAKKIEYELDVDTFIDKEVENNEYIENAEVYLNGRICAVYEGYCETTMYNELLQSIPVTSLEVDVVDGTVLYYFKTK